LRFIKGSILTPEVLKYLNGMMIHEKVISRSVLSNRIAIAYYNSKSCEFIKTYQIIAQNVTCSAFGGEHLEIIYVTIPSLNRSKKD